MAKRQAPQGPQGPRGPRMSDDQLRARNMMPFLRPNHVTENEQLRLTGFNALRDQGTAKEQIICEVENEAGTQFNLGIRMGSPDHRVMHRNIGPDWRSWRGSVTVTIARGRVAGHPGFVNVKDASRFAAQWDTQGGDEPPPPSDEDQ